MALDWKKDRKGLSTIGTAGMLLAGCLWGLVGSAAGDVSLSFEQVTTTGAQGRPKTLFLPGEEIQVRAAVRVIRASGNPFSVRLRILGDGWYEVLTRQVPPSLGVHQVRWGGPGSRLFVSPGAGPGKVALALDGFSEQEVVSAIGRRHAYITVRCPDGLPAGESARVQVGRFPFAMGLTADRGELYVTSNVDHNITVIDVATKAVIAQISDPERIARPAGVVAAPDGRSMLVADPAIQAIHVIDARDHALVETIPVNPDGELGSVQLEDLVISPATGEVLATDRGGNRLLALDLATRSVRQIPVFGDPTTLPTGLYPMQVIVDPENPFALYVLCGGWSEVIKVDLEGNLLDFVQLRDPFDLSTLWPVWSMAVNPVTDEVYVLANPGEFGITYQDQPMQSRIYALPKDRLSSPARRDFLVGISLWDLAVRQDGPFLYGIDSYPGEVMVIDPMQGVPVERCAVPVRPGGRLLLLDPGGPRLFVGNWTPGYVDIVE